MQKIPRTEFIKEVSELFETFPIVAILGARQTGKSTLAQEYLYQYHQESYYFDLESEIDQSRLQEAQLTLGPLSGLIILDEIQRRPHIFPILRYLVDHKKQKYLILGSASRDLIQQSSETLAGRIAYLELCPFSLTEVGIDSWQRLWWRGGFPRSFLAKSDRASFRWRLEYIKTFLERDLAMIGFHAEPLALRRFWQMLAHYHGQTFNASQIGVNIGVTPKTIQRYMDILEGTFMVRQLRPWFENINKRQVKSPKIYFKDSGVLQALLGNTSLEQLQGHPKLGASWEGFAMEEVIRKLRIENEDCYFWATSNQAELDLLVLKEGKRIGFEFKYTSSPKLTRSMQIAIHDLKLTQLIVVVPQGIPFPLSDKIEVYDLRSLVVDY